MHKIYKNNCDELLELSLDKLEKGAWVKLINPTSQELEDISRNTNVPLDFFRAALDEEERSRIEIEDNGILVLINIPIIRGEDRYDTLPLGTVITPDNIITVCLEDNEVMSEFTAATAKSFSTIKKTRFLFQILYKTAILYLKYIRQINRRTDEIERHLRQSMKNKEIFQLLELEKGLTYFTASLRSNEIVLEKLLRLRTNTQLQHLIKMYEEDEELLDDVLVENKQAIEMVQMYSSILSGMMDAFTSIISNNLNMVMKFLASMTILLAIPTMISSFFGMNLMVPFGNEHPLGFGYVAGISLIVTLVCAFGLWKKGML